MVAPHALRDGAVAKHEQLRARLAEMCRTSLSPGDALPSERQLCDLYGVSRTTVRDAVGQLVTEGMLVRIHGKGTFVAEPHARSQLHLASFHEDMRRLGLTPTTVVLLAETAVPPPVTVVNLGLRSRDQALHLRRLRLADNAPISVDDAWYNLIELPGLDQLDLHASIYQALEQRYQKPVDRAEQTVRAAEADDVVATVLGIRPGSPVLRFDRVGYHQDTPLEHAQSWYRSDRYELQMSLTQ
ncbi:GntR family transcriptional regulator [Nocardioides pocheonensis]|jgi:GntR family transcriptional regulator|uniref:GntR family transcriptional regulator n=1 Tax=Nocardioides pocheonensis TaxID=661485 RepID=A0A3N0GY94_9ACTN|nr:GntR family transcriptional regulator [Nocardioides pocheonensis]RNM17381.1 GntR family transcriptional regulator [Nocardioides pocheonensis]